MLFIIIVFSTSSYHTYFHGLEGINKPTGFRTMGQDDSNVVLPPSIETEYLPDEPIAQGAPQINQNSNKLINPKMTSTEIQNILNQGGSIKFLSGQYILNFQNIDDRPACLDIKSNTELEFEKDAIITCIPNNYERYSILNIDGESNVTIKGGVLIGDRDNHKGTTGEWGFGIRINNSQEINILNTTSQNCWGDGFIVVRSKNIIMQSCDANNNRRQGLSIISAENMQVINCIFRNTNGTLPEAGIDIEPDFNTDIIKDITVKDCNFYNNKGSGLEINIQKLVSGNANPDYVSVDVVNCLFENNRRGFAYSVSEAKQNNNLSGVINVAECSFTDNMYSLFIFNILDKTMPKLKVSNITIGNYHRYGIFAKADNPNDGSSSKRIVEYGGFEFSDINIIGSSYSIQKPNVPIFFDSRTYTKINASFVETFVDQNLFSKMIYWKR